jgi:hypothetical protein
MNTGSDAVACNYKQNHNQDGAFSMSKGQDPRAGGRKKSASFCARFGPTFFYRVNFFPLFPARASVWTIYTSTKETPLPGCHFVPLTGSLLPFVLYFRGLIAWCEEAVHSRINLLQLHS